MDFALCCKKAGGQVEKLQYLPSIFFIFFHLVPQMITIYFHLILSYLEQFRLLNVLEQFHLLGRIARNELFTRHSFWQRFNRLSNFGEILKSLYFQELHQIIGVVAPETAFRNVMSSIWGLFFPSVNLGAVGQRKLELIMRSWDLVRQIFIGHWSQYFFRLSFHGPLIIALWGYP